MKEKLCVFCKHFGWDSITSYSYSTYTSGMEGGASCCKGHYSEERPYDEDDFRKLILRAGSCADFALPDEIA